MKLAIILLVGIAWVALLILVLALCKAAARGDEQARRME